MGLIRFTREVQTGVDGGAMLTWEAAPRRIAVVSAVTPGERDSGKKVVLGSMLDYWCHRVGPESVHYVVVGRSTSSAPQVPYRVHVVEKPRLVEQLASVAWRTLLTRRNALQESLLYARHTRVQLQRTLTHIGADLEILDTVRMEQFFRSAVVPPGVQRVVYLDDLFSIRYGRMLKLLKDHPEVALDPLGEFRSHVPPGFRRLARNRAAQRVLLTAERRLIARREVEAAKAQPLSLLVNPDEVAALRARVRTDSVAELRPMIPEQSSVRAFDGRPEFVLLGLLSLPHNHDAALTFLSSCMAEVLRVLPDARVHIIGRGAGRDVLAAARPFGDRVVISGYVPSLTDLFTRICAVLAPLRFGSGIKIKVIEALAHGVPVLGTPCALEGIRTGANSGVVEVQDVHQFPAQMHRLSRPEVNGRLSSDARRHHLSTYGRAAVFKQYDEIFGITSGTAQMGRLRPSSPPVAR